MESDNKTTIELRQEKNKTLLLEQLKKTPIVHIACDKAGVGRATYYRWRKEDKEFTEAANQALEDGSLLVNDMAESQLLAAIKDRNLTAIIFWLKHHHPRYATRVEVEARVRNLDRELTPEQKQVVDEALKLSGLIESSGIGKESENDSSNTKP